MVTNSNIDFVLPWVDGSDKEWIRSFNSYSPEHMRLTDSRIERYRDWGLLKYWFRGVEKFAPWVRTIHFVTCGQKPEWLNMNAHKLHWVKHEDYIPAKYLPVFNVNPLELMMHKIPGLSDNFVYFNDDVYIIKPIAPERFFHNGLPCDTAVCNQISPTREGVITHIMANNMAIINEHFNKHKAIKENLGKWFSPKYGFKSLRTLLLYPWPAFSNLYEHHLPNAFTKQLFEEVWSLYGDVLEQTSMTRFRSMSNHSQWLMRDWRLVKGEFYPIDVAKDSLSLMIGQDELELITSFICKQKKSIVAVNDGNVEPDKYIDTRDKLIAAFEAILPDKSSFEL